MDLEKLSSLAWKTMSKTVQKIGKYEYAQIQRLERKGEVHISIHYDIADFVEALFMQTGIMVVTVAVNDTEEVYSYGLRASDAETASKHLIKDWGKLLARLRIEEQYREKFGFFGDCGTYTGDENGNGNGNE